MILVTTLSLMGIAGAVCVARDKALTANCLWALANPGLILHNLLIHEHAMAFMFGVYEVVALYGIIHLTRNTPKGV